MEDILTSVQRRFHGEDHIVTAKTVGGQMLVVEVEQISTAEQWTEEFSRQGIEDLTEKVGNFKRFPVFVNMLQSAMEKASNTVSLDLMTFADLERMRQQKGYKHLGSSGGKSPYRGSTSSAANKRYIILTYNVEFGLTQYPLRLLYRGQLDPIKLVLTVRELQAQLDAPSRRVSQRSKDQELSRTRKEYKQLLKEKEELEEAFLTFRQEVRHSEQADVGTEIRVLKAVIGNLEEDLIKDRSRHQREMNKKNTTIRQKEDELVELRSSNRNLQIRVKSLVNELAVMKRGQSLPAVRLIRHRSPSFERAPAPRNKTKSSDRSLRGRPPSGPSYIQPSVPYSGLRRPRFDPTAYVQERNRRQAEAEQRLGRPRTRTRSSSPLGRSRSSSAEGRSGSRLNAWTRQRSPSPLATAYGVQGRLRQRPSRSSSVESRGSRASSRGSSLERISDSSSGQRRGRSRQPRQRTADVWSSPGTSRLRSSRASHSVLNDSPISAQTAHLQDKSSHLADISARLDQLQMVVSEQRQTARRQGTKR